MAREPASEELGGYVRVAIRLDGPAGADLPEREWLWAEALGAGRYRLESSPFFAYGLSHGDLVRAAAGGAPDAAGPEAEPELEDVEHKSGHRTLRLALDLGWDLERPEVKRFLEDLLALGCTYEALPPQLVALDLPPEVEESAVVARLQTQRHDGVLVWEWADPRPS